MVQTALCCTARPCLTLRGPVDCSPPGSSVPGMVPCPPPGIFLTRGSNPGPLHCRWILYQLSHKGSPGILEWVAYPFSSGSSWPGNRTGVSCIAGRFFTSWAMRDALTYLYICTHIYTHTHITYIHISNTYSVLIICNIHIISVIPSGCKRENQFPRLFLAERKPEGSPRRFSQHHHQSRPPPGGAGVLPEPLVRCSRTLSGSLCALRASCANCFSASSSHLADYFQLLKAS